MPGDGESNGTRTQVGVLRGRLERAYSGRLATARLIAAATLCAGALTGPLAGQSAGARLVLDSATTRLWLDGNATMGSFTARATSVSGWAELPDRALPTAGRGEVRVGAAALRTGIGLRDRHLRQELDTDRYPTITLVVNEVSARAGGPPASAGLKPVMLTGTFTVKGVPHPVTWAANAGFHGDTLVVSGSTPLRFTGLGMRPPTRLLGTVRVRDELVLGYEARFVPERR